LKCILLLGAFAFAQALSLGRSRVSEAPDFHRARELKVLTVVIDESNKMRWGQHPDPKKLLGILARAESSMTNNPGISTGNIQISIDLDGSQWFVNFPLPLPDDSRPYLFYVSGRRANEVGIPVCRLSSRDARRLGILLNALKSQKPIE
jgi:hypothetical protein